jgi:DNA-binding transcriptional MerR regulator
MPTYLPKRAVAEMFGVNKKTIEHWCERGMLTPIKVNSRLTRFHIRDVRRLEAELGVPSEFIE